MTEPVLLERPSDGVAVLRLHRPDARNALSMDVRRLLARLVTELGADAETRCIVLAGSPKVFAAGADIKDMAQISPIDMMARRTFNLWNALAVCPKPMIAAVTGYALGGGSELAMLCDIIIAGESAKFGQPEVKIGIIPGGGATQRLTRAVGKYKAMKILLTGEMYSAKEAFDMGLASEVVPDAEVESRALAMAKLIAELPPLAVQQIKEVVLAGMDTSLEAGIRMETKGIQLMFASQDQKEGMAAFIEKRKPKFEGK
jgi:enoyl-CoA hydratase/carnithine racemase